MPKGLPYKGLFKKITSALRMHSKAHAHRLPGRGVWLLGLAVFLTSVTIAAIIPRGSDTPAIRGWRSFSRSADKIALVLAVPGL